MIWLFGDWPARRFNFSGIRLQKLTIPLLPFYAATSNSPQ